ncbi:C40 family peptidase [Streptomyces actinomycinicus]|uniref:C40 family peptidase n=1 Tax=Streptomyces actinomycinicus TaxID=1695166 RepID=A0A937EG76_9ACTN|nr:NlpC/P60 family protein [Streptomyces actinomycinicus]MBL1082458.1 C40 family peptidase [Streptomyces actinomycinicus]
MLRRTGAIATLITLLTALFLTPSAIAAHGPARTAAGDCGVLAPGASTAAERAVDAACAQVAAGTWYTWGGGHGARPGPTYGTVDPTDPASEHDPERLGFDCSGLVRYAYAQATGADILNGDASTQYYTYRTADRFTAADGLAPLRPGDLLAYGTSADLHHIALYLGAGKMVEARQSGTKLMVSDVRLGGDYFGAVRINTATVEGPVFRTWGTGVWTKAEPSLRAARVYAFPGPTTIRVACQKHAEVVTAEGYTNDAWSYLPDYHAWVTNIYIQGPAWLDGVPTCTSE